MYLLASKFVFFRVSFTIEPGRCLLQFVTTNCVTTIHIPDWKSLYDSDSNISLRFIITNLKNNYKSILVEKKHSL